MTRPTLARAAVVVPLVLLWTPGPTVAQDPRSDMVPAERCEAGVITHIFIDNHSIFDTAEPDLNPAFRWAYDLANRLHIRTREGVIRREILFDVGDCFEPIVAEESERLLRAHDFIGRADVYGIEQPDGGYHVVVDTEDEWSTQADLKFDLSGEFEFEELHVREENLLGTGRSIGFFYESIEANRSWGFRYLSPQALRTRWDLAIAAGRTRAGSLLHGELSYPFVGEEGKWAFRQWYHREDRLFDYVLPDALDVHGCGGEGSDCRILVPVRRNGFHIAGLRRFGERGNLTVVGGGVSYQDLSYPGTEDAISLIRDGDYRNRTSAPPLLLNPTLTLTEQLRNYRLVVLLGKRNITWQQRRGLDSFRGDEDIRIGAEVEMAFARSIPGLGGDNDLYGSMDMYVAAGPPSLFFGARLRTDARRDYDTAPGAYEMKDVFGEGEAFLYVQPTFLPRHTLVFRAAGAAGWHVETPFQLTLGGERSLRGWPEEALPGGRRVVFTAEDRWHTGWPFPDVADVGTSIFADVGRVWPGEVPFGVDSGWRAAIGVGIRANFPARGTNTFRIDAAFPVGEGGGLGKLQLLIGVGEYLGVTSDFADPQFGRSRMPPVTGNLLHFPN